MRGREAPVDEEGELESVAGDIRERAHHADGILLRAPGLIGQEPQQVDPSADGYRSGSRRSLRRLRVHGGS